jgi:hypothetical protein
MEGGTHQPGLPVPATFRAALPFFFFVYFMLLLKVRFCLGEKALM